MAIVGYTIALLGTLYIAYSVKARLGIDLGLLGEGHTPQKLEDWTGGCIKCKWFANSHHCRKSPDSLGPPLD